MPGNSADSTKTGAVACPLPLYFARPFLRARAAATMRWVAMTARFIRACILAHIRIKAPQDPWSNQLARQPTVRSLARPAVWGAHQPRPGARHWRRRSLRDAGVPAPQRPHPGNARTGTCGAGCACRCFGPGRASTHCSVDASGVRGRDCGISQAPASAATLYAKKHV